MTVDIKDKQRRGMIILESFSFSQSVLHLSVCLFDNLDDCLEIKASEEVYDFSFTE